MDSPITPTIGRIVLYKGKDGETRPAIVSHAWGQNTVNIHVFGKHSADTEAGVKTSAVHGEGEGQWSWMPYQKQTAGTRHMDAPPLNPA
jgi:hypothetical protein